VDRIYTVGTGVRIFYRYLLTDMGALPRSLPFAKLRRGDGDRSIATLRGTAYDLGLRWIIAIHDTVSANATFLSHGGRAVLRITRSLAFLQMAGRLMKGADMAHEGFLRLCR